jgi:hypothetical protein
MAHQPSTPSVERYYRDAAVQARIAEYCGARAGHEPSAAFVAALHPETGDPFPTWERSVQAPVGALSRLLGSGSDVARSLWDHANLIVALDLDYQRADDPAEPFTHPAETFLRVEPVFRAVRAVLRGFGAMPFVLTTGRGYHLTGRVPLGSSIVPVLARLQPGPPLWYEAHVRRHGARAMPEWQARAVDGLGLLIEHLAHLVLRRAAHTSPVPVVLNGTAVGHGPHGQAAVSIDFSFVGDPVDVRHLRAAFSTYQLHRLRPDIFGAAVAATVPPLVALPRARRSLLALLESGRGLEAGLRQARVHEATLPDVSRGIGHLLAHYLESDLAAFHRGFYAAEARPALPPVDPEWPPCLLAPLSMPNDLLLKPAHIQHVTRGLVARGWSARQVAALVRGCYEADHGWGDRWTRMHPRLRAEFDVRVFAGLLATGLDRLVDHNCVSAQEKGLCPGVGCTYDLRNDRDGLHRRMGAARRRP